MILLVCGGRGYNDYEAFCSAMAGLPFTPSLIVQGGARGADSLARAWALQHGVHYAEVPALWNFYGKAAGSKRNAAMLALAPGYCLAMPGGAGTADMVRRCIDSGFESLDAVAEAMGEPFKRYRAMLIYGEGNDRVVFSRIIFRIDGDGSNA